MPIYGELGRYPLSITIKQRMVCYWTRILKSNQHKLNKVMYSPTAKETPTANETPTAKETPTANETPTAKETTTANDAPPANSLQGDRDDDFQLPRSQRRRNDRRNKRAVFGTKGGTELKGGERYKEIFIFNLESGTTADAISEYMNRANVTACEVECKSNEESRLKSFRVRVKDTQYGTAMMADMWPQNVGCRPYFRSRARPNRSDEFSGDM